MVHIHIYTVYVNIFIYIVYFVSKHMPMYTRIGSMLSEILKVNVFLGKGEGFGAHYLIRTYNTSYHTFICVGYILVIENDLQQ